MTTTTWNHVSWMRTTVLLLVVLGLGQVGAVCGAKGPTVTITSPTHGVFVSSPSVTITGTTNKVTGFLTVNGVGVPILANRTWSHTLPLDFPAVLNPVEVEYTEAARTDRKRIVVIAGDSIADGSLSPQSIALRLTDDGLDQVEPTVAGLVNLDIAAILPVGLKVIDDYCALDSIFGCVGSVDVFVANPPASLSGFSLQVDSMTNFVTGDISIFDIRVDLDIVGSGLAPSCGLRVTADQFDIDGDYALQPDPGDPSTMDVNLNGAPVVGVLGFDDEFTSGLCDFPLIGPLIQLIIGDIEPLVVGGLSDFLADPDAGGPLDAPIADAIEVALAGISISGAVGNALGLTLESPLFDVAEDNNGITLGSDSRFISIDGVGPGECPIPAGAPDFAASYHVAEAFPTFGATTPGGGLPYDLGLCVSASAFNQLMKASVECGLLATTLTEIDIGFGPQPITAGLLGIFIPQFTLLNPSQALEIVLRPTLAPIVTGNNGPGGELAEMLIGQLEVDIQGTLNAPGGPIEETWLTFAADARLGFDLTFDNVTGELVPAISEPLPGDLTLFVTRNVINTDVAPLEAFFPLLFAPVLPSLSDQLGSIPIPAFFGLVPSGVETGRNGQFMSVFLDLNPVP